MLDEKDVEGKLIDIVEQQKQKSVKTRTCVLSSCLTTWATNREVMTSQILTFVFMDGWRYDITLIVAIQHVMQLPPALRSSTD
ncbi:unnamed protein product [Sphacelaria rigidula]